MNFINLSPLAVVAGLFALAGLLYALQQLRARFLETDVETLIFWKAVIEDSPVKVLREKFKHLWAYLFILLICALIWLAIAGPDVARDKGKTFSVLLMDNSVAMESEENFQQALSTLRSDLNQFESEGRQVIICGSYCRTLLNPGEDSVLLDERLKSIVYEPTASSIDSQLSLLAAMTRSEEQTNVLLYSAKPVNQFLTERFPESFTVKQQSFDKKAINDNVAIASLGTSYSESGDHKSVDILFKVVSNSNEAVSLDDVELLLNGQLTTGLNVEPDSEKDTYRIKNLNTDGQLLTIRLKKEDDLSMDNEASIRLPGSKTVNVALSNVTNPFINTMVSILPEIKRVDGNPDILIRKINTSSDLMITPKVPSIDIMAEDIQQQSIIIGYPDEEVLNSKIKPFVESLDLDRIHKDDTTLSHIDVSYKSSERWTLQIKESLLSDKHYFVQLQEFPIFFAQMIAWFAGDEAWYPYVAVGKPIPNAGLAQHDLFMNEKNKVIETMGAPFIPLTKGNIQRKDNQSSLYAFYPTQAVLDVKRSNQSTQQLEKSYSNTDAGRPVSVLKWLLILILVLVGLEWYFFQTRRIP